jgi:hypothetical protein
MSSSKRFPSVHKQPKGQKFFLGKEEKDKSIFFFLLARWEVDCHLSRLVTDITKHMETVL